MATLGPASPHSIATAPPDVVAATRSHYVRVSRANKRHPMKKPPDFIVACQWALSPSGCAPVMGGLAQVVEHWIRILGVGGSMPPVSMTKREGPYSHFMLAVPTIQRTKKFHRRSYNSTTVSAKKFHRRSYKSTTTNNDDGRTEYGCHHNSQNVFSNSTLPCICQQWLPQHQFLHEGS